MGAWLGRFPNCVVVHVHGIVSCCCCSSSERSPSELNAWACTATAPQARAKGPAPLDDGDDSQHHRQPIDKQGLSINLDRSVRDPSTTGAAMMIQQRTHTKFRVFFFLSPTHTHQHTPARRGCCWPGLPLRPTDTLQPPSSESDGTCFDGRHDLLRGRRRRRRHQQPPGALWHPGRAARPPRGEAVSLSVYVSCEAAAVAAATCSYGV